MRMEQIHFREIHLKISTLHLIAKKTATNPITRNAIVADGRTLSMSVEQHEPDDVELAVASSLLAEPSAIAFGTSAAGSHSLHTSEPAPSARDSIECRSRGELPSKPGRQRTRTRAGAFSRVTSSASTFCGIDGFSAAAIKIELLQPLAAAAAHR